jgi:hypothetical protein
MTKPIQMLTNLPFAGFYESLYSGAIDREEESFAEYEAEESDREDGEQSFPEPLRLTSDELAEILLDVTDYPAAYRQIAEWYVEGFDAFASERLDFPLGLKFESMSSPTYYNFETDRVFAHIPLKSVRKLFAASKADGHKKLAAVIAERFTSCSGFYSHYSNDLARWLEKPLREWDHNEVGTLLIAVTGFDHSEDEDELYERTLGDESAYRAWSEAVDWPKFEAKRREAREEKVGRLREDDPTAFAALEARAVRCDRTRDLFATPA